MAVNKAILVGNVGKDPETRYLEGGTAVSRFSLATSEVYKNKNGEKITNTDWHNIVVWRGLAEIAEKYIKKGTQLYVEGRIKTRSYTDKDGNTRYTTEIVADNFQMLGRKSDNASSTSESTNNSFNNSPGESKGVTQNTNTQVSEPLSSTENPSDNLKDSSDESDDLPF